MSSESHIPAWITAEIFESALVASVPGYKDVHSFKVYDALGPGENYVALALKAEIKVRLTDYSLATQKFFLKVSHDNDLYNTMFYKWNVFIKELDAYKTFIPDFEKMYRDVGLEIHFGPKHYELQVKYEYLLLEDLTMQGFRNVDRQQGLDMEHCRSVLKKLAQWHAASAVRMQRKGPYDKIYMNGGINPEGEPLVKAMTSVAIQNVLNVSKDFADSHIYHEQLSKLSEKYTEFLFDHIKYNPDEFNVLCHGDFWCNNIMFQHDDKRKIKEVRLIDYQLLVCGSPAQDVVYFILTSAQYQIKTARFDELIRYYHSQLREHLELLKYSKPVPTLGDIHKMVIDSRAYSTFAAFSIMPVALADPVKSATLDNLTSDSAESIKLKEQILRQEKISKNLELVLPWLYFKGHLEYNK